MDTEIVSAENPGKQVDSRVLHLIVWHWMHICLQSSKPSLFSLAPPTTRQGGCWDLLWCTYSCWIFSLCCWDLLWATYSFGSSACDATIMSSFFLRSPVRVISILKGHGEPFVRHILSQFVTNSDSAAWRLNFDWLLEVLNLKLNLPSQ